MKIRRAIKRHNAWEIEDNVVESFNNWWGYSEEEPIEVTNIEIKTLDNLHDILPVNTGWTMALFGASKSGKTTLLRDFIKNEDPDHIISLFSATLSSGAYDEILDYCDFS